MYASPSFRPLGGRNILRSAPGCLSTKVQRIGSDDPGSGFQIVPSHKRTATFCSGAEPSVSFNRDSVIITVWSAVFIIGVATVCQPRRAMNRMAALWTAFTYHEA